MVRLRPEYLLAASVTIVCLFVLENLPVLKARTPTMKEVEGEFGPPYPAAYSDYLAFTLPANARVSGPGYGTIVTNSLGYRGQFPKTVEKPKGTRRLLFVGDSFTLGWGLREDETIPAIFQKWLDSGEERWEVINAAYHGGCSPDAYYAYLRREGTALEPDALITLLYTTNDVTDLQDNVWTQVDDFGAPRSLSTFRTYTDYRGHMLNPRILPWYYSVPVLSRSRVFLNSAALLSRPFSGVGVPGSGRLGTPLSEEEARRRFALVTQATARLASARGWQVLYAALALPGTLLREDRFYPLVHRVVVEDLQLPLVTLHPLIGREHAIPGDAHLNRAGAAVAAAAIWRQWTGGAPPGEDSPAP